MGERFLTYVTERGYPQRIKGGKAGITSSGLHNIVQSHLILGWQMIKMIISLYVLHNNAPKRVNKINGDNTTSGLAMQRGFRKIFKFSHREEYVDDSFTNQEV